MDLKYTQQFAVTVTPPPGVEYTNPVWTVDPSELGGVEPNDDDESGLSGTFVAASPGSGRLTFTAEDADGKPVLSQLDLNVLAANTATITTGPLAEQPTEEKPPVEGGGGGGTRPPAGGVKPPTGGIKPPATGGIKPPAVEEKPDAKQPDRDSR